MRPVHLTSIIFSTTLLIGCGPNVVDINQLANQGGDDFRSWDFDDPLEIIYNGVKPFTGIAEYVYGDEDGIWAVRIPFKKGKSDFTDGFEAFYRSGQIAVRCEEFRKPRPNSCYNGRFETWYADGQRSERGNWKDGKKDGLTEKWHENGQLSERVNFKDGDPDGPWEKWDEDGQVMN